MVAFGLIARLMSAGVDVPGDISVIGFDDIEMSEFYIPALTTIRQDRHLLGRRAAEVLLTRLRNPGSPVEEEKKIPVELVVRASTSRLRS
jgi:LacI family repressor for deo operon, udp, cdd, tsx, nupC, and nupG